MRNAFLILLLWPMIVMSYPLTPDKNETPGSVCLESDDDFEEYRYEEQIAYCHRNVASSLKTEIYEWYEIASGERKNYTIDHLIPLSLGGDNTRVNLWPEHKEVKAKRPALENQLYAKLRDGEIRQRDAIQTILEAKFNPRVQAKRLEIRLRPLNLMDLAQAQLPQIY